MASARPSRRPGSWTRRSTAAAAVAVALALTGCSATNPITTSEAYNVVDGVQESLSDTVAVRNLLVFTRGEGEPGVLVGALSNSGREDVQVTLRPEGAGSVTVDVPARGTVLLGGDRGETVELATVGVAPGALLTVTASASGGGDVPIKVPVYDDTLPEYADVVPQAEPEA